MNLPSEETRASATQQIFPPMPRIIVAVHGQQVIRLDLYTAIVRALDEAIGRRFGAATRSAALDMTNHPRLNAQLAIAGSATSWADTATGLLEHLRDVRLLFLHGCEQMVNEMPHRFSRFLEALIRPEQRVVVLATSLKELMTELPLAASAAFVDGGAASNSLIIPSEYAGRVAAQAIRVLDSQRRWRESGSEPREQGGFEA